VKSTPGWHIYIIRCGDGSLYTGIATDVRRRFAEHESGLGARYLRGRGPLELVLSRPVGDRSEALRLEQRVKRLPKRLKELVVAGRLALEDIQH
jgi:putative endonuclease